MICPVCGEPRAGKGAGMCSPLCEGRDTDKQLDLERQERRRLQEAVGRPRRRVGRASSGGRLRPRDRAVRRGGTPFPPVP